MKTYPLIALTLVGCVIGDGKYPRPRDLDPSWLVDRPRVLGIRAEPPEVRPGETVTFEALIPQPGVAEPYAVVWLACPPTDDGGIGFGCAIPTDLDLENASLDELAAAGFIGFEPFLPPSWTVPVDALDALAPEDRLEGQYTLIQVTALPPEYLDPESAPEEIDFNDVEAAYKRLIVSEAPTPNHNPDLVGFTVDGLDVPDGALLHVDRWQEYELSALLAEDALETYTFVTSEGTEESREEEPYLTWFATGGTVNEPITLYPYPEATWTSPDEPSGTTGTIWAVVRDRRGGMSWISRDFVVD